MARRGALTALQAVLAGVSGGAQGYVQQRELERKREQEKAQQERQTLMDTISLFEKGAFEAGPIATRAPSAPPQARAAAGEEVKAPRPSMSAIPLAGVSPEAMQQAEAGLSRYETGGPGAMPIEIGGRRLVLPSAATRRAEAAQDELLSGIAQARARADIETSLDKQKYDLKNKATYNAVVRAYGKPAVGEFDPAMDYEVFRGIREAALQRTSAERAAAARASGASSEPAGPNIDYSRDIAALSPFFPGEEERNGRKLTIAPRVRLNGTKLLAVMQAAKDSPAGQAGVMLSQKFGADYANEMTYYNTVAGIATAYAIKEQRGRNVSDRDIQNRIAQVALLPQEIGNPTLEALKANRVRQWASALTSGNVPYLVDSDGDGVPDPGQTSRPPILGSQRPAQTSQPGITRTTPSRTSFAGIPYNSESYPGN